MTNLTILTNLFGHGSEMTTRQSGHTPDSIVSRFSLASLICACMLTLGVGNAWGAVLTFDLTSNPGEWPTANDADLTDYTYSLDDVDYTFALKNVKCNSGYLMLTQPAVLGLPAISGQKLTSIVVSN